jgi:hypothetical protein
MGHGGPFQINAYLTATLEGARNGLDFETVA